LFEPSPETVAMNEIKCVGELNSPTFPKIRWNALFSDEETNARCKLLPGVLTALVVHLNSEKGKALAKFVRLAKAAILC
jgi:hypothetical protein